ncbi:MAG: hypothetical protein KUA38_02180, partial [Hydrogenophaga sp.]|nr:hypothetical protein [Hydrogenophaga sp.]
YYQHTVDELVLIAAFENYAKGELLLKQFIPHEINAPKDIKKEQKSKPIHIRTCRKHNATIGDKTIFASTLLKPAYNRYLNLSALTLTELDQLVKIRNLAHFQLVSIYGLSLSTANAIQELKDKIFERASQKHLWHSRKQK